MRKALEFMPGTGKMIPHWFTKSCFLTGPMRAVSSSGMPGHHLVLRLGQDM
jgi:hypothetical protein